MQETLKEYLELSLKKSSEETKKKSKLLKIFLEEIMKAVL